MLHAELLARLKHPRPILINGKQFEARSTPVHFMMTSNHRAPSIEMSRVGDTDERRSPSPPLVHVPLEHLPSGRSIVPEQVCDKEPNEDRPHVMISLALEEDQRLDLNAWEQWLSSFPALAKYVTVQGVFKSHSTLLLLSMPVMIWDLLPEDQACSFVAFIRSNNLIKTDNAVEPAAVQVGVENDRESIFSGTTVAGSTLAPTLRGHHPALHRSLSMVEDPMQRFPPRIQAGAGAGGWRTQPGFSTTSDRSGPSSIRLPSGSSANPPLRPSPSTASFSTTPQSAATGISDAFGDGAISRRPLLSQARTSRRQVYGNDEDVPEGPPLASHVVARLEDYYRKDPQPNVGMTEYYASNLGIVAADVNVSLSSFLTNIRSSTDIHAAMVPSSPTARANDGQLAESQDRR